MTLENKIISIYRNSSSLFKIIYFHLIVRTENPNAPLLLKVDLCFVLWYVTVTRFLSIFPTIYLFDCSPFGIVCVNGRIIKWWKTFTARSNATSHFLDSFGFLFLELTSNWWVIVKKPLTTRHASFVNFMSFTRNYSHLKFEHFLWKC